MANSIPANPDPSKAESFRIRVDGRKMESESILREFQ